MAGRFLFAGRPSFVRWQVTLHDLLATDMARLLADDDFGTSVVYRTPDGTEATYTAVVFDQATEPRDVRGVQTLITSRGCTFRKADIGEVNLRGVVLISGVEWSIDGVLFEDDEQVSVVLQRHELVEATRPGYRRV